MGGFRIKGKKIFAKVIIDGKNIEIKFGTLNSTDELFELINPYKKNIKKIYINNIIIKKNEETCLFNLGINKDFNCVIESNNE